MQLYLVLEYSEPAAIFSQRSYADLFVTTKAQQKLERNSPPRNLTYWVNTFEVQEYTLDDRRIWEPHGTDD